MPASAIPATTRAANLVAAQAFVDWINALPRGGGHVVGSPTIPEGYLWSLDVPGTKFVRIVMEAHPGEQYRGASVHAFVDLANGDLYKPAGWKAPAKGVRGNIATADGLADVQARFTWSGGYLYLR